MLPRNLIELERVHKQCRSMVLTHAGLSAGAAAVPIPGLDLATDVALLTRLLPQINQAFGLTPEQIEGLDGERKKTIYCAITKVGNGLIGRFVTQEMAKHAVRKMALSMTTKTVAKYVPFAGSALSAGLSFSAMKLVGNRHVADCYGIVLETLLLQNADPA